MSFQTLNKDELIEVAEFFNKDVVPADEKKGPTKAELIAALASKDADIPEDEPVTWEDYKDVYLVAKADGQVKSPEVLEEEELARQLAEEEAAQAQGDEEEEEEVSDDSEENEIPDEDAEPPVLVKCERKNPRFDVAGYTFTKDHPFHSVPPATAEYLIRHQEGFRQATPSELADFYN